MCERAPGDAGSGLMRKMRLTGLEKSFPFGKSSGFALLAERGNILLAPTRNAA